jgi:hypothetical protein
MQLNWNRLPTPNKVPFQVFVRISDADQAFQQGNLECRALQGSYQIRSQNPLNLAQAQVQVSFDLNHLHGEIFAMPIYHEKPSDIIGWLFYGMTDTHVL